MQGDRFLNRQARKARFSQGNDYWKGHLYWQAIRRNLWHRWHDSSSNRREDRVPVHLHRWWFPLTHGRHFRGDEGGHCIAHWRSFVWSQETHLVQARRSKEGGSCHSPEVGRKGAGLCRPWWQGWWLITHKMWQHDGKEGVHCILTASETVRFLCIRKCWHAIYSCLPIVLKNPRQINFFSL